MHRDFTVIAEKPQGIKRHNLALLCNEEFKLHLVKEKCPDTSVYHSN